MAVPQFDSEQDLDVWLESQVVEHDVRIKRLWRLTGRETKNTHGLGDFDPTAACSSSGTRSQTRSSYRSSGTESIPVEEELGCLYVWDGLFWQLSEVHCPRGYLCPQPSTPGVYAGEMRVTGCYINSAYKCWWRWNQATNEWVHIMNFCPVDPCEEPTGSGTYVGEHRITYCAS